MLFWWICGGESVLPVLLLRHLGSSSLTVHLYDHLVSALGWWGETLGFIQMFQQVLWCDQCPTWWWSKCSQNRHAYYHLRSRVKGRYQWKIPPSPSTFQTSSLVSLMSGIFRGHLESLCWKALLNNKKGGIVKSFQFIWAKLIPHAGGESKTSTEKEEKWVNWEAVV